LFLQKLFEFATVITDLIMVLVTGATGFLGSHLMIYLLENDEKVVAIYRDEIGIKKSKSLFSILKREALFEHIQWIEADILDIPALEIAFQNIKTVYHCAALISFDPKDENLLRKINIEGTANIVNFCLEFEVEKLCYVSSTSALGDLLDPKQKITETTEWNPEINHSDYAISKYGGEIEVWRGQQEGLNVVVVNPGVILGVTTNWQEGSGKIFASVAKQNYFYTNGSSGFISVNDVVKIMFELMKSNLKNKKYILVAENITFKALLDEIAENLAVVKPKFHANPLLIGIAWRLDWLISALFSKDRNLSRMMAKLLHSTDLYANEKIKKALNFEFESITDTIQNTAKYYKMNATNQSN